MLDNQSDPWSPCDNLRKTGLPNVEGLNVPRLRFHFEAPKCPKVGGRPPDIRAP